MYLVVFLQDLGEGEIVRGAKLVSLQDLVKICAEEQEECSVAILKQDGSDFRDLEENEFKEFSNAMADIMVDIEEEIVLPLPEEVQQNNNNREE